MIKINGFQAGWLFLSLQGCNMPGNRYSGPIVPKTPLEGAAGSKLLEVVLKVFSISVALRVLCG